MDEMKLSQAELTAIIAVMDALDGKSCFLRRQGGNGIGYTLQCIVDAEIEGIKGQFVVPITDVEMW